jgi:sugar lactone lactonase YvrE
VADPTQPTITTIAGSGISGYADGLGNTARFNGPCAIAVHSSGNIYIADTWNHRIRKITNTGIVSTIAGSGAKSFGDGTGVAASFNLPVGIAVDANENLYVVDQGNNRIRKITPNGVVTTAWYGSIQILRPQGIAVDANGNIYVTDCYNKIQKINIK